MSAIWKYELGDPKVPQVVRLRMPRGAVILSAGIQDVNAVVWVLVRPEAPSCTRKICLRYTGEVDRAGVVGQFVATLQSMDGGEIVASHVFDLGEGPDSKTLDAGADIMEIETHRRLTAALELCEAVLRTPVETREVLRLKLLTYETPTHARSALRDLAHALRWDL